MRGFIFVALVLLVPSRPASAEVTGVTVTSRTTVAGGQSFAGTGPYERLVGRVDFALDPDDPHALIGRGFVYCQKQQFDRAVQDFDAALGICPTCPRAISGRAAASGGKECP